MKMRTKTKNMAYASLCTAFLAVCAFISIPSPVPFSMQTFGLFFVLLLLGGKWGSVSVLLYIALGIIGVPVFSGFNSGIGVLFGPTGGFVVGFLGVCAVYWLTERILPQKKYLRAVFLALGMAVCYVSGTAFYMLWCADRGETIGVLSAITICVLPYIIPDILKLLLAIVFAPKIKRFIKA